MKKLFSILLGIIISFTIVGAPKDVNAIDTYLTYDELKVYTEKQQEDQWSTQLVAYSQTLVGKRTGQCVTSLRNYFGISKNEVQGMAKSTKINSKTGKVGAIIVFRNLSKWGHVGYIIKDDGDSWLYFHSNYGFNGRGRIDRIKKIDAHISGYRLINY